MPKFKLPRSNSVTLTQPTYFWKLSFAAEMSSSCSSLLSLAIGHFRLCKQWNVSPPSSQEAWQASKTMVVWQRWIFMLPGRLCGCCQLISSPSSAFLTLLTLPHTKQCGLAIEVMSAFYLPSSLFGCEWKSKNTNISL